MRQGKSPQQACEEAIKRIANKPNSDYKNFQVGYIAINKKGETGSYSIHQWFSMTKYQDGKNENIQSDYFLKENICIKFILAISSRRIRLFREEFELRYIESLFYGTGGGAQ